jgi:hypothetical protein
MVGSHSKLDTRPKHGWSMWKGSKSFNIEHTPLHLDVDRKNGKGARGEQASCMVESKPAIHDKENGQHQLAGDSMT